MKMRFFLPITIALCLGIPSIKGEDKPFLPSEGRLVFLGDSITAAGQFIAIAETQCRQQGISPLPEFINLGLPSETCSGLSEPKHPFPRPNVQERLERALEKAKPSIVVACYGMNDGIYYPFDEKRFTAYKEGINRIISKVRESGARLILMTPPPFDPVPLKGTKNLLPAGEKEYNWTAVYENYNDVIQRYASWVGQQSPRVDLVIDQYEAMTGFLAEKRKKNPDFVVSGDGVHIHFEGHEVMASAFLKAIGLSETQLDETLYKEVRKAQSILHDSWLTHVGHLRPGMKKGLPLAEAEKKAADITAKLTPASPPKSAEDLVEETRASLDEALALLAPSWLQSLPKNEKPVSLFNGYDLTGWDGSKEFWSAGNGMIRGANSGPVPSSTYLFTDASHREFRLLFEVKQTMSKRHSTMHSAVAALGERFNDKGDNAHGFKGPLLMFCHDWGIWDAYRRNRIEPNGHRGTLVAPSEKKGDWNMVEFLVRGNRIQCAANGVKIFDFTDKPEMLKKSPIGLQLHSNQRPQEFFFRNLYLVEDPGKELSTLSP